MLSFQLYPSIFKLVFLDKKYIDKSLNIEKISALDEKNGWAFSRKNIKNAPKKVPIFLKK